jgi:hypothetical protein
MSKIGLFLEHKHSSLDILHKASRPLSLASYRVYTTLKSSFWLFLTPLTPLIKGGTRLKVPRDISEATSSFPLFKGDGRGISKGGLKGVIAIHARNLLSNN